MLANGGLDAAPRTTSPANSIIRPVISFGIMPAPGADSRPNGRSPLIAKTPMPSATNAAPATWSARSRLLALDLADLPHGILHALGVGVPECLELRLVEVGDVL